MTNEPDDIKTRAEERRDFIRRREAPLSGREHAEAEADLDRAIAIAAELKFATDVQASEIRQARADVLKCRDALLSHMPRFDIEHKVLADTEHYENYR